jgi:spermidine synthase
MQVTLFPLTAPLAQGILVVSSRLLLDPGEYASFNTTLIISAATLLPVTFLSGFLFVKLSVQRNREEKFSPGSGFAVETAGGITAGIFVAVAGGGRAGNHTLIALTTVASLLMFVIINLRSKGVVALFSLIAGVAAVSLLSFTDIDRMMRSLLLKSLTIESSEDSRYGNVSVSQYREEKSILYNHRLHSVADNSVTAEENIHYVMLQHQSPTRVAVISGGINNHLREIMKYRSVKEVFYLERDPLLTETEIELFGNEADSVLNLVSEDAWRWIRESPLLFDIVIVLMQPPATFEGNRYFTDSFYSSVKRIIAPGGYFITLAGESSEYTGKNSARSLAVIGHTLERSFNNILPLRGGSLYIIASDNNIDISFPELVKARGINNKYVNQYYINSEITSTNSRQLREIMTEYPAEVNSTINPVLVRINQLERLSREKNGYMATGGVLLLLTLIPLTTGGRRKSRIWGAAFTLSASEIVILILLQSTLGTLYHFTGILIAAMMAGLAAGASGRCKIGVDEKRIPLLIILFTVITASCSALILKLSETPVVLIILSTLIFIPGFLTGRLYHLGTSGAGSLKNVSSLYASDLTGSAAGFLAAGWFLIPGTGVRLTLITIAFINFVIWLFSSFLKR